MESIPLWKKVNSVSDTTLGQSGACIIKDVVHCPRSRPTTLNLST